MCVFTAFNVYADADACCIGAMANAAMWQHHPLPQTLRQPFKAPTVAQLQARGLVDADGKVADKAFAAFYAGDYGACTWPDTSSPGRWRAGCCCCCEGPGARPWLWPQSAARAGGRQLARPFVPLCCLAHARSD